MLVVLTLVKLANHTGVLGSRQGPGSELELSLFVGAMAIALLGLDTPAARPYDSIISRRTRPGGPASLSPTPLPVHDS